ncbi:coiled-coil domain-containing protein [Salininema proteolyticum]|uniref:Coiled-coil domain-containing protein n=1 Tax=Salininema proteolyticum TaxID=1607685 RepID=A0ABV8U326_9ACTN
MNKTAAAIFAALAMAFALTSSAPAAAQEEEIEEVKSELADAADKVAEAEQALEEAEEKAKQLEKDIAETEEGLEGMEEELSDFAFQMHVEGELSNTSAILASGDPDSALDALSYTSFLGEQRAGLLNEAETLLTDLKNQKEAHADQIEKAEKALKKAEKARGELKDTLEQLEYEAAAGPTGTGNAGAPSGTGTSGPESCSEADPTTSGCLTPRTLNVYNQSVDAGFTRYTACYRPEEGSDHGTGQACDFSADENTFQNYPATGSDKEYGDNLAAWYVNYYDVLSVKYVIWYKQFWSPSTGWQAYNGGTGAANTDHTNHVHVSVN